MKFAVLLLCIMASGCGRCAYGYSSACDAGSVDQQQQQDEENKDKKEKAPSASWN